MSKERMAGGNTAEAGEPKTGVIIQALDRGLMVLEALVSAPGDVSLSQLSAQFPWHKTTTLRLLSTLAQHGHVEQDRESGRYRLGLGILRLSSALDRRLDLRERARGPLRQLAKRTRETAHMAIYDRGEAVVLEQAETAEHIRIITYVGMRMPCHCTALGKVLLSHLAEDQLALYIKETELEPFTDRTLTEEAPLRARLAEIRDQGYAYDDREYDPGMNCMAAPIRNRTGRVVASVGVSGPTHRMQAQEFDEIIGAVTEAGMRISQSLGCPPAS